jgi:hypothetical protein
VRWTKSEFLAAGRYKFTTVTDDGVRLFIDGRPVIDQWHDQSATAVDATVDLDSGVHTIRMEYFDSGWEAQARLSWDTVDQPELYKAEYWNTPDMGASPPMPTRAADVTRQETTVDHTWYLTSPDPAISADHFIAQWTRTISVPAGSYQFAVAADDGVRLFVDGVPVIDKWIDQSATTWTAVRNLSSGEHTVVIQYYEDTWDAVAKFSISPM